MIRARMPLVLVGLAVAAVSVVLAQTPAPELQMPHVRGDLYRFRFTGASGVFLVTAEGINRGLSADAAGGTK